MHNNNINNNFGEFMNGRSLGVSLCESGAMFGVVELKSITVHQNKPMIECSLTRATRMFDICCHLNY